MSDQYDVIVVGGGLAGLSAAHELGTRNKRVLVLEANDQLGGKVITRRWHNQPYECGALFAFDPNWVPFPVQAGRLITNDHPIGVIANGQLIAGDSVLACLEKIGLNTRTLLLLNHFFECESPQPEMIGAENYAILNAFFQVIHPGELASYVPARRRDSLVRHAITHFSDGNESLVKSFIANTRAEICPGSHVTNLSPKETNVTVRWRTSDGEQFASADWVVLAVPAPEAKALTAGIENVATKFLTQVQYGKGITVTLGLANTSLQRFSYIVWPDSPVNTFVFHNNTNAITLTAYLVGERTTAYWNANSADLTELVRAQLNRLNIGVVIPENISFSDVYRWSGVGPIISDETYGGFSNAWLRPSDRIVLAGDYTWWNKQQMPYGMQAAFGSGKRAAEMICDATTNTVASYFQFKPLATSLSTVLTDQGPKINGSVEDGTIAYYGFLLSAEPDIELERYLLGEAEDGLWSYQQGYGVTSLDSALVMEGLLATGRHGQLLNHSADRMVTEFFNRQEGGFQTIPHARQGRASYWQGTDCPATAYCAWLLAQIAPERYGEIIKICANYLRRKQNVTGGWAGKWFPSETIPVFYAVRLLALMGTEFEKSCQRARLWLWGQQRKDGSWLGSVIESAAALLALCILGESTNQIRRGCEWIQSRQIGSSWAGEPILQYWFEEDGRKTLFHTCDQGQITTAWAKIALRKVGCLSAK